MNLLNIVEIESINGCIPIEIYHGDITNMGESVDLLVTSAFIGGYKPIKKSLFGALNDVLSINIEQLSKLEKIDLRNPLNCWVTDKHEKGNFDNIMIIEMKKYKSEEEISLPDTFKKMFIAINLLEQLDIPIRTIALPILGSGLQDIDYENVIKSLIDELKNSQHKISSVQKIKFVEYSEDKAIKLSDALDKALRRVSINIDGIISDYKKEIIDTLRRGASATVKESTSYENLINTLNSKKVKSIEIGIACRRMTELLLVEKFYSKIEFKGSMYSKINNLYNLDVATWVISYLHFIRIFGNEAAHENISKRTPSEVNIKDISILLQVMQRVLHFFGDY